LCALCFKFSAKTFFAEDVAKCACPCGIKSYDRILFTAKSSLNPTFCTSFNINSMLLSL
jgi:hypothetical protein